VALSRGCELALHRDIIIAGQRGTKFGAWFADPQRYDLSLLVDPPRFWPLVAPHPT